jgi:hypothetical protein
MYHSREICGSLTMVSALGVVTKARNWPENMSGRIIGTLSLVCLPCTGTSSMRQLHEVCMDGLLSSAHSCLSCICATPVAEIEYSVLSRKNVTAYLITSSRRDLRASFPYPTSAPSLAQPLPSYTHRLLKHRWLRATERMECERQARPWSTSRTVTMTMISLSRR